MSDIGDLIRNKNNTEDFLKFISYNGYQYLHEVTAELSIGDEYTTSLIFSIVLYASSKSWDKFATRAYTLYSDMGDDTESECPSADEELFTSTSSSNTITTPNLVLEMPDQTVQGACYR
ncbi:hypothetical protein RhiirB3_444412 [Rhizophagus irregularis]|nr:hypothetical protein RhiirB3_444412 [Rhizophagus irregularis]